MTTAATMAPNSGRPSRRGNNEGVARFGTSADWDLDGVCTVWVMRFSDRGWNCRREAAAWLPPDGQRGSAGVLLRVRENLVDVRLVDDGRTGEYRFATAEDVAVGQVEPQRVDGFITLQVRLLVDGELQRAVLDVLGRAGVEVEGDHLRLAPRGF